MEEKQYITVFDDIPRTVWGHFRIYFFAAVYRLINYLRRLSQAGGEKLESIFKKYPFLAGYFEEINPYLPGEVTWESALAWWQAEIEAWEKAGAGHLPLQMLVGRAGVSNRSIAALMLLGLVEEDSRFGTLFAGLQAPLDSRRPCLQLVEQIMMDETGNTDPWQLCGPLVSIGIVKVLNRDAPRSEWVPRVLPVPWDVIRGKAGDNFGLYDYDSFDHFPGIESLIFPAGFLGRLKQVPGLIRDGRAGSIVLRGSPGSERLRAAGALARAMGRNIITIAAGKNDKGTFFTGDGGGGEHDKSLELMGSLCTMTCSLPLLVYDLAPGETADIPLLRGYSGPFLIVTGLEGGLRGKVVEKAVTLTIPVLEAVDRRRCWREVLPDQPVEVLAEISERFHMPGAYIRQAAAMAFAHAGLEGRDIIGIEDVRQACGRMNRQLLDTLADRLEVEGTWDRLVVNAGTADKLRELERRCRNRERIFDNVGPAFGTVKNTGVRALFSGASGTGKTLAARILAAELGMDLYRVDLAAVVNKYIGETEKNLHRVLTRAEELDVILLLDEGDALLGTRTEVRTANDRYANLETDYLLQKLENYRGIVVVTSNAGENIDSAFQRRMDVVVNFVPPQARERWYIWQLHLPADHGVDDTSLEDAAARCRMTGGQIRNAALHAALLALDDGGSVTGVHLAEAVQSEYRKAGAICPLNGNNRKEKKHGGIDAFRGALLS